MKRSKHARAVGTMKLKTLRKAGVVDLSQMFGEMPKVKEEHLVYADEAGLTGMLTLLDHKHPKIRALAETMLTGLDKDDGEIIVADGGCKPIREMISLKDLEVQKEALWSLASLAGVSERNHDTIITDIGWNSILSRSKGDDPGIREPAICLIANLCLNEEMHDLIMGEGGIEVLKDSAKSGNLKLQRAACNGFANLTAVEENVEGVISDGGLDTIISFLDSSDEELLAAALHTLANIIRADPAAGQKIVSSGNVPKIIKLMKHKNGLVRMGATACVRELLSDDSNHEQMLADGLLKNLCDLGLRAKNPQMQYSVASSFHALAANPNIKAQIKADSVRPLKELSRSSDSEVKQEAIDALACLGIKRVSKADKEKAAREKAEKERAERELAERERAERERAEREAAERKRLEEEARRKREEEEARRRREEEERKRREEEERKRREEEERKRREEEERRRREEEERKRREDAARNAVSAEELERKRKEEEERRKFEADAAWRRSLLAEMNMARARPQEYAAELEKLRKDYDGYDFFLTKTRVIETLEGEKALDDAIATLKKQKPLPEFSRISQGMTLSCQDLCDELGPSGAARGSDDPADRWGRYGDWSGKMTEIICYRLDDPKMIVQQWIIDDGDDERYDQQSILNPNYSVVGFAYRDHVSKKKVVVVEFASKFTDDPNAISKRANERSANSEETETSTHYIYRAKGIDSKNTKLIASGHLLKVTGKKEETIGNTIRTTNLNMAWQVPTGFDTNELDISCAGGVLTVKVPKKCSSGNTLGMGKQVALPF